MFFSFDYSSTSVNMASFVLFRQAGFLSSSSKSAFAVQCTLRPLLSSLLISNFSKKMGLPKVFFDMSADNQPLGRIVIEVSEKTRAFAKRQVNLRRHFDIHHACLQVISSPVAVSKGKFHNLTLTFVQFCPC